MTFKEFMRDTFRSPAAIFDNIVKLILGDHARKKDGSADKEAKPFLGLLGLIMEGVKWIGKNVTGFLKNHRDAIASAFWLSLIVGGAAALTVAFWPAALAAVANFTIAGFSIASVVGTGFAAQVGATAGIAAVAASVATYAVATVANFVNWVKSCCTKKAPSADDVEKAYEGDDCESSASTMARGLGAGRKAAANYDDVAPEQTASLYATPRTQVEETAYTAPIASM